VLTVFRRILSRRVSVEAMIEFAPWMAIPYLVIGIVWAFFNIEQVKRFKPIIAIGQREALGRGNRGPMTDVHTLQLTTIEVRKPADGKVVGEVPADTREGIAANARHGQDDDKYRFDVGAMATAAQRDIVTRHGDEAVAARARVIIGGKPTGVGLESRGGAR
jgi:acyl-CoA reductase-like NAD-dependent aldehyde dehydrogenase